MLTTGTRANRVRLFAISSVLALSMGSAAVAGDLAIPTPTSNSETRGFVGLNWSFGNGGGAPEVVVGVARVTTESDGDANGAKLSVHLPVSGGLSFGKVKLTGMTGASDRMVEVGMGYGPNGVLGTVGVALPYFSGGVDFGLDGGLGGYAGVNSLEEWTVPTTRRPIGIILGGLPPA